MEETQKVIYVAASVEQADLLAAVLGGRGIAAHVDNEAVQFAAGQLMGWPALPRVVVNDEDALEARTIALEFEKAARTSGRAENETQLERDDELQLPWPCCPNCGQRRHTSCPACETAGTTFPPGFMGGQATDEERGQQADRKQLVLVCPICDEVFVPGFLARCEWCGYRFADGREAMPAESSEPSEFNGRALAVLAGIVITVAAMIAFFAVLVAKR